MKTNILLITFLMLGISLMNSSCSEHEKKTKIAGFVTEVTFFNGDIDTLSYSYVGKDDVETYLGGEGRLVVADYYRLKTIACGVRTIKVLKKQIITK